MKKNFIAILILFCISSFYGHAPSEIKIDYDSVQKKINVDVKHNLLTSPVQDPKKHFIKTITLRINGKTIKTNTFKMQDSIYEQLTTFDNINAVKGNKITVEAECSLLGSKSATIVVK
jgi:hypothetical protein